MELPHELAYSVAQQVRDYEVTHVIWSAFVLYENVTSSADPFIPQMHP